VSSAHARIGLQDGAWHVEDVGSKNGTQVNGTTVGTARLVDGDCLQIGQTLLILRTSLATPADTQTDVTGRGEFPAFATLLPQLAADLDRLASIAPSKVPILLLGETGTGKELLARAAHELSRRPGSFVPVNCGGLPPSLAESILFGHRRGAFSGAAADQPGLFRTAHRGTLLLDEVGDITPGLQAAVLRALQDGEVLALGDTKPAHVDARIVAATHRDLTALAAEGCFREDLLARLSGFTFTPPPLRQRREDIGLMLGYFLRSGADGASDTTLTAEAGTCLLRSEWPRNVRQLEKAIERARALAAGGCIELQHLPEDVRSGDGSRRRASPEGATRDRLVELLGKSRGNVSAVATTMRTSRSQVHRWIQRYSVDIRKFRS
jgi:transcriptional regulator with GAF, ATPase, and Fis domain